jgi:hypothetical protein
VDTLRNAAGGGYYGPAGKKRVDDGVDAAEGKNAAQKEKAAPPDPALVAAEQAMLAKAAEEKAAQQASFFDTPYRTLDKQTLVGGLRTPDTRLYAATASDPLGQEALKSGLGELVPIDQIPVEARDSKWSAAMSAYKPVEGQAPPQAVLIRMDKPAAGRYLGPQGEWTLAEQQRAAQAQAAAQAPAVQVQATPAQLPATSAIPVVP